jgi:hypothetical protein
MLFELLFLGLFFGSLITLLCVLVLAIRGLRGAAVRVLKTLGAGWVVYLLIVVGVSAASAARPQRTIPRGEEQCFDEMCFSVVDAQVVSQLGPTTEPVKAAGRFYIVTVRVSSRARRRTQREGGLRALLWDAGKYYAVSGEGQHAWAAANGETAGLTARLRPGESIESMQVFDVPMESSAPALVLSHGFTPGYFVIGECPLFHKPTVLKLSL